MLRDGLCPGSPGVWLCSACGASPVSGLTSTRPALGAGSSSVPVSVLAVASPALMLSSTCDAAACCCLWQHVWVRGTKEAARGSRHGAVFSICCHELCCSGDST